MMFYQILSNMLVTSLDPPVKSGKMVLQAAGIILRARKPRLREVSRPGRT